MLHNVKELERYSVEAVDGPLGTVTDLYFDDKRWAVRYFVVETGSWLKGRKVLISPNAVQRIEWDDGVMRVSLTQQQLRDSPGIDADKPVSRQNEIDHHLYYGYPNYWEGGNLWGLDAFPVPWVGASPDPMRGSDGRRDDAVARERHERLDRKLESADWHLRSGNEVIGYEIMASDGPIGGVENFVFDDKDWAIRYMVVDTRKWLPGKHVLVSPEWIDRISWPDREVHVKIARHTVETSPEYDTSHVLSREHETALHAHYQRTGYWQ
ncbi:MAG: PRC-barrel domain-containing protein [Casimicrobiaceae bacterium]